MEDTRIALCASNEPPQPAARSLTYTPEDLHQPVGAVGKTAPNESSNTALTNIPAEDDGSLVDTNLKSLGQFERSAPTEGTPMLLTLDEHTNLQRSSSPTATFATEPDTPVPTHYQPSSEGNNPNETAVTTQIAPMIQPDIDIDDEAYAESTSSSYVTSIASEILRGVLENERVYPHYGKHSYGMPVDEDEMDRMDLQHRKYEMVIGDRHFLAPIGPYPQRILDLGTGTGIWALDVADMFPSAQVVGVDIAPIQPRWVATNCQFEIDDIEEPWTWKPNSFDFIHFRDPLYVVRDWSKLMNQIFHHLKPGGWCELAAIYPLPMCDDGSMPEASAFLQICKKFLEAAELFGTPADVPPRFKDFLKDGGFVDIGEHIFKVPSSPWPKDKRLKKIGALELTNVVHGATAFGLRAFTQVFGWTKEEVEIAMIDFRRDVGNRNYHQYCQYIVAYGRKPFDTPVHLE